MLSREKQAYGLYLESGGSLSQREIATRVGLDESDVSMAISYYLEQRRHIKQLPRRYKTTIRLPSGINHAESAPDP